MKFATIATIAAVQAISKREPWDKSSLPDCPSDKNRITLDDGETHVSKYPNVGATCQVQIGGLSLVMLGGDDAKVIEDAKAAEAKADVANPDAKADAAKAVAKGEKADESGKPAEKKDNFAGLKGLEHCPDFNERFTLANGRTKAIKYPNNGYNCSNEYGLVQRDAPWPANVVPANIPVPAGSAYPAGLEHCPDRPERQTITGGIIRAVPFPTKGYNCMPDIYPGKTGFPSPYALQQLNAPWPANVVPANIPVPAASAYPAGLEHCPDRPERQTLRNGQTKPIPFPAKGANCIPDIHPGVEGVPAPYH